MLSWMSPNHPLLLHSLSSCSICLVTLFCCIYCTSFSFIYPLQSVLFHIYSIHATTTVALSFLSHRGPLYIIFLLNSSYFQKFTDTGYSENYSTVILEMETYFTNFSFFLWVLGILWLFCLFHSLFLLVSVPLPWDFLGVYSEMETAL